MKALRLTVRGRVQRVGYRRYLLDVAQELGVSGWAKNNPDGSVTVHVQGKDDLVEKFLEAARNPPPPARIRSLEAREEKPAKNMRHFKIKYGPLAEELQEGFGAMQTAFYQYWDEFREFRQEMRAELRGLKDEVKGLREEMRGHTLRAKRLPETTKRHTGARERRGAPRNAEGPTR